MRTSEAFTDREASLLLDAISIANVEGRLAGTLEDWEAILGKFGVDPQTPTWKLRVQGEPRGMVLPAVHQQG